MNDLEGAHTGDIIGGNFERGGYVLLTRICELWHCLYEVEEAGG